jgi:hypothetical protein
MNRLKESCRILENKVSLNIKACVFNLKGMTNQYSEYFT